MREISQPPYYPTVFDNRASWRANLYLWLVPPLPFACLAAAVFGPRWAWGWSFSAATISFLTVVAAVASFVAWIIRYGAMVDSHSRNGGAILVNRGQNAHALNPEEIRRSGE